MCIIFIDNKNKLHKALKPAVIKLYPNHKKEINAYIDSHKVDFTRQRDLVGLLSFCNQLK